MSPFSQFNFQLRLGGMALGGFQEMSSVHGLNKSTDVTMKRGVVNASALNDWLKQGRRELTVELQDEAHRIVMRWTLHQAKAVRHDFADPSGSETAIAELVVTCERIESEEC